MDKVVYNAISKYYDVLEKTGYLSYDQVYKLLVLSFFYEFVTPQFDFNQCVCPVSAVNYRIAFQARAVAVMVESAIESFCEHAQVANGKVFEEQPK